MSVSRYLYRMLQPHRESYMRRNRKTVTNPVAQTKLVAALRLADVMEATGLARATIYKHIGTGKFPPGVSRTDMRLHTWGADEIEAWKRGEWKAA